MLIDFDLRGQNDARLLGMKGGVTVADVLRKPKLLDDNFLRFSKRLGFFFWGGEQREQNPSPYLRDPHLKDIFLQLSSQVDYLILDTPPLRNFSRRFHPCGVRRTRPCWWCGMTQSQEPGLWNPSLCSTMPRCLFWDMCSTPFPRHPVPMGTATGGMAMGDMGMAGMVTPTTGMGKARKKRMVPSIWNPGGLLDDGLHRPSLPHPPWAGRWAKGLGCHLGHDRDGSWFQCRENCMHASLQVG